MFETSWLVAVFLGLLSFYLVRQWMRISEYPPGPFPLPFLGNILAFRVNRHVKDVLADFKTDYGGIYTIWMANNPFVIVVDWNIAKEGLIEKRNDIISRPTDIRSLNHMRNSFVGIAFEPNNRNWEVSRKVGAGAIRKFVDKEKLAELVKQCTDQMIDKMLSHEGKPFEPTSHLQSLIINVISETAFGTESDTFSEDDNQKIQKYTKIMQELGGNTPGDISTLLLILYYARDLNFKNTFKAFGEIVTRKYHENKKSYQKGEIRNFSDAVIAAGLEAEEDENDAKQYLDDNNMIKIIGALFLAGTETTTTTLRWLIILLARFQDIQKQIRDEIDKNIRERMPLQSDQATCPYTRAFVSETIRFRAPLAMGLPHVANVDTQLGGHKIKRGTLVLFHADAVQSDDAIWKEAEKFDPTRFLKEDGKYNNDTKRGILAFGEGKRICIGEKMAKNDLFLIVANLIQNVEIRLETGQKTPDLEPDVFSGPTVPKKYNITVVSRNY